MKSRWTLPLLGSCALLLVGCGVDFPNEYPLAQYTRKQLLGPGEADEPVEFPPDAEEALRDVLFDEFGGPADPFMKAEYMSDAEADRVFRGSRLYQKHCIHCHGLDGGGNGPTAPFLYPRPRDYRKGVFKWKSTAGVARPTRSDLSLVLHRGAMGSSMPPFKLLPEEQLQDLISYVIFLSKRGEFQRSLMLAFLTGEIDPEKPLEGFNELKGDELDRLTEAWKSAEEFVTEPKEVMPGYDYGSPAFEESLERGRKLYLGEKAACYKCHNRDGRAAPEDIAKSELEKMVDDWGNPNYPRNLTLGMYRGGRRPIDLYRRIHDGIKGAAMPAGGNNLTDDQIWDLVNLVRAIPYRPGLLPSMKSEPSPGGGH